RSRFRLLRAREPAGLPLPPDHPWSPPGRRRKLRLQVGRPAAQRADCYSPQPVAVTGEPKTLPGTIRESCIASLPNTLSCSLLRTRTTPLSSGGRAVSRGLTRNEDRGRRLVKRWVRRGTLYLDRPGRAVRRRRGDHLTSTDLMEPSRKSRLPSPITSGHALRCSSFRFPTSGVHPALRLFLGQRGRPSPLSSPGRVDSGCLPVHGRSPGVLAAWPVRSSPG